MATTTTTNKSNTKKNTNGAATTSDKKPTQAAKGGTESSTNVAAAGKKRDKKLPIARRVERSMAGVIKKFGKVQRTTAGWSEELDAGIATIAEGLGALHKALGQVGDDFVPPRRKRGEGGGGKKAFEVNQIVDLTDKGVKYYADAIEEGDTKNIVVKRVSGKKFIALLKSGMTVILMRAHAKPQLDESGAPKFKEEKASKKS